MIVGSSTGMKSMLSTLSLATVFALLECSQGVQAQLYMQNPKGSNNRLNEATDIVTTANRLFTSNNNLRGGYNVGDRAVTAFNGANPYVPITKMYDTEDIATTGQYDMQYIEGSRLQVQWMNQHGCGGDVTDASPVNCELILQYMCQSQPDGSASVIPAAPLMMGSESLLNGGNTGAATKPTTLAQVATTTAANTAARRGRHESEMYYYECSKRSRNLNLFTGSLGATMSKYATATRQNPTGATGGMECNEERDYYPYWSPSPWKDMAILTDHSTTTCVAGKFTYASQNNLATYKCVPAAGATGATYDAQLFPITKDECTAAGGAWTGFSHFMDTPDCLPAPWSSGNHLGNGVDGRPLAYDWILPKMDKLVASGATVFQGATADDKYVKCVMRFRYNVTLDEQDPYQLSAANNTSPILGTGAQATATVNIGTAAAPINVAVHVSAKSLSTTYEDRSHTFYIRSRPAAFPAASTIVNVNVRGKRCNIVQCNPAVEYDYAPHDLVVQKSTFVHYQWTGSNTHNNAAGAAALDDGQDGDAGQGAGGTDRQNIAQALDLGGNYPIPLDKNADNMWTRSKCFKPNGASLTATSNAAQSTGASNTAATECALWMTTSGQFRSLAQANAAAAGAFNNELNTAPASLIGGVIMQFAGVTKDTKYSYISTRNNNFTNRGQKGEITVTLDESIGDVLRS